VEHARKQAHLLEHHHGWIKSAPDLIVAFLLGLSLMSIAWGAYKAEVKSKNAENYFKRSEETLGTAQKLELQGGQEVTTYEQLFLELERDRAEGSVKAVAYLRLRLMTPDLMGAITWWEHQPLSTRPPSPFVNANPRYHNIYYDHAVELEVQATRYVKKAHKAEQRAIDYMIVSVILTAGLFLFGISTEIGTNRVKVGLLGLGAIALFGSIARLAQLALS
jgi:hypothetical protein